MPNSPTIELAADLISRPSVTPKDEGCQQLLATRLAAAGFTNEHMPFSDVDNLWSVRGNEGPIIVFAGHTDVVPTGPESQWQSDPFGAHVEGGFLHGRGAADMKGSIAAMVIAIENFIAEHPGHTGRIGFLITSDEEGPAVHGTKAVIDALEARNDKIDYCIVGEPTSTALLGDTIKVGRRGSMNCVMKVIGKQGHHLAMPLLEEIRQIKWDAGNAQFPPTSLQFSNINAGTGVTNVIPGEAIVTFNLRFSPEITDKQIIERIEAVIAKHNLVVELDWRLSGHPFQTQYANLIKATENGIEKITGRRPDLSTSGGTSDGRFIAPTGAEVIELGPVNKTIHQIDEKISVDDLDELALVYQQILEEILLVEAST
jgi:succinyl-diaminopimelate desuccinylase